MRPYTATEAPAGHAKSVASRPWTPPPARARPTPRLFLAAVDRLVLYSHLSTMMNAGIQLQRALDTLRRQTIDRRSEQVLDNLYLGISSGHSLSRSLATMPTVFSRFEIGVVRSGELSGALSVLLGRLAGYEERRLQRLHFLRSVLLYPVVVFCAALLLILVLTHFLVSGVLPVMQQAQVQLPASSALLVKLLTFSQHPAVMLVSFAFLTLGALGFRHYAHSEAGKRHLDRFWLDLPMAGTLLRKIETVRVCESLSTLYSCGLPLTQCLERTADLCTNSYGRDALVMAERRLLDGESLARALASSGFFPRVVHQMVEAGEQSGRLGELLTVIARYNDLDVRAAVEGCAAALEPILIVFMGGVVAAIIIIAFLPLYQVIATLN